MFLIAIYVLLIFLIAAFFVWIADNPGTVTIHWDWLSSTQSYEVTLLMAVLATAALIATVILLWWILTSVWNSPKIFGRWRKGRRRDKGYQALSKGLIAAGSGNAQLARKLVRESDKLLTNEPLVSVLDAQTALLEGNHAEARKQFESMLGNEDTKLLGLRGLYVEAEKENVPEAAAYFAKEANTNAPGTPWAGAALLKAQTAAGDWADALVTLKQNKSASFYKPDEYKRKRAIILTALAMDNEDRSPDEAVTHALAAHKLVPDLVPAAVTAARIFSRLDKQRKAGKILEKTWTLSPHPEIADDYVNLRSGDSSPDRLARAKSLLKKRPEAVEGLFAVAKAATDAGDFELARNTMASLLQKPTEATCLLMADLEEAEHGDRGRVREWLMRAVSAPKDAAWTADGMVSEHWAPLSPVTGQLDAFEWKVPLEQLGGTTETFDYSLLAAEPLEEKEEIIDLEPLDESSDTSKKTEASVATTATAAAAALATTIANAEDNKSEDATPELVTPAYEDADAILDRPIVKVPPVSVVEASEETSGDSAENDNSTPIEQVGPDLEEANLVESNSPYTVNDLDSDKDGIIDHRPDDPGVAKGEVPKKKGMFF